MKTLAHQFILINLVLTLALASANVLATDRFILQDSQGFCTSLPQVEKITLTHHIREWRTVLLEQQRLLTERVEQLKFTTFDAVVTLVMPGGLLYAAVKQGNHLEKRQNLSLLTEDIAQLSGDLLALETTSDKLQVTTMQQ
jgi:enhancing lycopene biosynthesis protein 2